MNIKARINHLIQKFKTRDPFEIADCLNISVVFYPMHQSIHGFYDRVLRRKFIVINSNLPCHQQRQTCAHELGHALMHKGWGYYFMIEHTFHSPGRFEREANEFAWLLLFDKSFCDYAYDGDIERYVRAKGLVELAKYAK